MRRKDHGLHIRRYSNDTCVLRMRCRSQTWIDLIDLIQTIGKLSSVIIVRVGFGVADY